MWPREIVYDSGTNNIFVANTGSASVSVISDSTNAVVATIQVGMAPSGMAYDSNKGEIFVANSANNTVSVISDTKNTVAATIAGLSGYVGLGIEGVVYNPAKGEIFAGNVVISDSTNTVIAQLPYNIGAAVYNPSKGEVITSTNAGLDVYSDSSSATTSPTPIHSTASAAPSPTVPEFGSAAFILVVVAVAIVSLFVIRMAARKTKFAK
jgi:YVTN family beta-propeller protein